MTRTDSLPAYPPEFCPYSPPTLLPDYALSKRTTLPHIHGRVYERSPQAHSMPDLLAVRSRANYITLDACDVPLQRRHGRSFHWRQLEAGHSG